MPWIESHSVLIRHRKTGDFARDLRVRRSQAIGHLHALWHVALEQQEDGDLSAWSDEFIAESSDFSGNAPQYVRLLQKHRWLDGRLIHDWLDYAGRYLESKYKNNPKRMLEIREKHNETSIARHKAAFSQTPAVPPTYIPTDKQVPTNQPLLSGKPDDAGGGGKSEKGYHKDSRTVLHILNEASGRHFRETDVNLATISARLKEEGVDLEGVRKMIARQCQRWLGTDQAEYLRPETLFGKTKFDGYYAARELPIESPGTKPAESRQMQESLTLKTL